MTERKWTPGPWSARHEHEGGEEFWFGGGVIYAGPAILDPDDWHDAHLISAAPDLYEALDRIVFDWDGEPEDMAEARAALAKARGEE